jgi:hypothetical protein
MEAMLDAIAAGLYSLASMLVGEGEDGVRLVETAVATAEVSKCQDLVASRQSSRRALATAALELLERRSPGCLKAPEVIELAGNCGCVEEDDLKASGVSPDELAQMIGGPNRDRVRAWLAKLSPGVRTVFVLRAVAGFSANETVGLLAAHGGPLAAGWNTDAVRAVFRQGLCSLASQLVQAGKDRGLGSGARD